LKPGQYSDRFQKRTLPQGVLADKKGIFGMEFHFQLRETTEIPDSQFANHLSLP
jgi:hypothetical protein